MGLISADEVIFAGGIVSVNNKGYWLYTGQYYWTMTPYISPAVVFSVNLNGRMDSSSVSNRIPGVRPVINLRSDVNLNFENSIDKGTFSNPYIVQ